MTIHLYDPDCAINLNEQCDDLAPAIGIKNAVIFTLPFWLITGLIAWWFA